MRNARYDFSSIHVEVPFPLADEIFEWGNKNIPDHDLFENAMDSLFGREDELHITVLYGIHSEIADPVRQLIENSGPVLVKLGKISLFSNSASYDVIMIEAFSEDLNNLNRTLRNEIPFTNNYGVYRPHVTLAYVNKGKARKYVGTNIWNNLEFECDYAIFSSKNGTKEHVVF